MKTEPRFVLVSTCFFLSGFAALIYQTAWTQRFALVFGTSELAVATVLAAYMGGLAAGAGAAGRLVHRIRRPVLAYALLELGIALSALVVPAAISAATALYLRLFGGAGQLPDASGLAFALFYLGCSFAILLVPTALMGATLPILARHAVRRTSEIGPRVGLLYAINTAGAVGGTLAAGFVLLPALGLRATVWIGVAANACVFLAAALLARGAARVEGPAASPAGPEGNVGRWILPVVMGSGAISFTYEVLWSRLLGHLLGGSIYGFATMLASFLTGIAAGSAIASRLATDPQRSARGFAWAQLGAAALSLLAFAMANRMPALFRALVTDGGVAPLADAAVAAAILLPGALCIGATLPFAVRVLARSEADAARASARVYAWNTCGAIAGAIGAGFFLLPLLGYSDLLTAAVLGNLALAFAASLPRFTGLRRPSWVAVGAAVAVVLLSPDPPWNLLRSSALTGETRTGEILYFGVGRSATILLSDTDGELRLHSNGLPEAAVNRRGLYPQLDLFQLWFGAMPSMLRPDARSMLIVGLGGGSLVGSIPPLIEAIDVVEIEPEVIRANRAVTAERRFDPLADPRVRLIENDARGALLLADKRYDAIASQPSHPWSAGAAHLYTREFLLLVRDHLAPDGVFAQWMGPRFVDPPLLRSLAATFVDVFDHVQLYRLGTGEPLLFVASTRPLSLPATVARAIASAPEKFAAFGVHRPEDAAYSLLLDEAGVRAFAGDAPVITDDRNLLQMRSFALGREVRNTLPNDLFDSNDPYTRSELGIDRIALVQRLLTGRMLERARRVAEAGEDPTERAATLALVAAAGGRSLAGRRLLERALELDSDTAEVRAGLLRLRRPAVAAGRESATLWSQQYPDPKVAEYELAVLEGWRAEAVEDWDALRDLEPRLALLNPSAPLAPEAIRLRVAWRLSQDDPALARESVALLDPLLAVTRDPGDWVLRARAVAAAGEAAAAMATLREAHKAMTPGPARRKVAWEALGVLENLPDGSVAAEARQRLEKRLRRLYQ